MTFTRVHNSPGDWDFLDPNWSLSTIRFVSAPSSLLLALPRPLEQSIICNLATTLDLPQGRVSSFFWWHGEASYFGFVFRNTAAPPSAALSDSYVLVYNTSRNTKRTFKRVAGVETLLQDIATGFSFPFRSWVHMRITWWLEGTILYIRLERWDGTAWVKLGEDGLDADPSFVTAAHLRCGLYAHALRETSRDPFDDTRIYRPT